MGNDRWYSYLAPRSGRIIVSLCPGVGGSASYDACLAVFSGTCGALTEIACNDDFCGDRPQVEFDRGRWADLLPCRGRIEG
ncbi:MAG: hypothetical protein AAF628_30020 [Planctomycetota bacterium]